MEVDTLSTQVSEMEARILELENRFSAHLPSSLVTSTSAAAAREQFEHDNEESGRNVVSKLSKISQELASKLCQRYRDEGSEVGEIGCWVSSISSMFKL